MIILDTDAVSQLMRPRPPSLLLTHLAETPADQHATTAITIGELAYGAYKVGRQELYERAMTLLSGVTVVDFDRVAAQRYGELRATLDRVGTPLADPDLRIAAIVLAHQATLVTGNLRHFARISSLSVQDWVHGA